MLGNTRTMLDPFARGGASTSSSGARVPPRDMRGGGGVHHRYRQREPARDRSSLPRVVITGGGAAPGGRERDPWRDREAPGHPALKAIWLPHAGDPAWLPLRPPLVELPPRERELLATSRHCGFAMPDLRGLIAPPARRSRRARRHRCITTAGRRRRRRRTSAAGRVDEEEPAPISMSRSTSVVREHPALHAAGSAAMPINAVTGHADAPRGSALRRRPLPAGSSTNANGTRKAGSVYFQDWSVVR